MAHNAVDLGRGILANWGALATATATDTTVEFAWEVTGVDWSGISANAIDTTHFRTSTSTGAYYRTFLAGDAIDGGQISLTFHFDPTTGPTNVVGDTQTLCLHFWDSADDEGTKWHASCIGTDFAFAAEPDDKMVGTATFQVAGTIVVA
jgi:hypothetical protein